MPPPHTHTSDYCLSFSCPFWSPCAGAAPMRRWCPCCRAAEPCPPQWWRTVPATSPQNKQNWTNLQIWLQPRPLCPDPGEELTSRPGRRRLRQRSIVFKFCVLQVSGSQLSPVGGGDPSSEHQSPRADLQPAAGASAHHPREIHRLQSFGDLLPAPVRRCRGMKHIKK